MSCSSCYTRHDVAPPTLRSTRLAALAASLFAALSLSLPAQALGWHDALPQAMAVGSGEFRWLGFSIYSARLWSGRGPFDANAPFALELTYHRAISRNRLIQTSIEQIRRLYGDGLSANKLKYWELEMARAFRDVVAGDQLIGVFLPLQGCRFYSQKEWIADIPDQEFATAFFSIWLNERTADPKLRTRLLGATQ